MTAICSLYEYISSGRCDTLEGQAGAYNLYEMELRQNVIIGQLEKVISQLESIKNNQYMLYSKLNEANHTINCISSQLNNVENNSNIAAYHSQITAENTEFMKWFNMFSERKQKNM